MSSQLSPTTNECAEYQRRARGTAGEADVVEARGGENTAQCLESFGAVVNDEDSASTGLPNAM